MSSWGISFTGEMLDALRAGRKTVTRRPITDPARCPYTASTLLVKEQLVELDGRTAYAAGHQLVLEDHRPQLWSWKRRTLPARFMPKWAARTRLIDVQVSAEQLGSLTEADAWAEGVLPTSNSVTRHEHEGRDLYRALWERIHGPESWDPELWVWRVAFQVEQIVTRQFTTGNWWVGRDAAPQLR